MHAIPGNIDPQNPIIITDSSLYAMISGLPENTQRNRENMYPHGLLLFLISPLTKFQ
ncbi:hypothetical protein [Spirulina major]|uniref:hypothetical protein n=1 Tax=Spirulina major TaxID=270636 RepID=UPI001C3162B0|nr:hypothetical protein [Spirulina major]